MTATDQMRAMLDQLMGTSRNGKKLFFVVYFICQIDGTMAENMYQVTFSCVFFHFSIFRRE